MRAGRLEQLTLDDAARWLRYVAFAVLAVGGLYFAFVDGDLLLGAVTFGLLVAVADSVSLRREVRVLKNRLQD